MWWKFWKIPAQIPSVQSPDVQSPRIKGPESKRTESRRPEFMSLDHAYRAQLFRYARTGTATQDVCLRLLLISCLLVLDLNFFRFFETRLLILYFCPIFCVIVKTSTGTSWRTWWKINIFWTNTTCQWLSGKGATPQFY